ncbi:MAG TPA: hypothetical protein VIM09_05650, partial [Chthoniobacterales bacterium]
RRSNLITETLRNPDQIGAALFSDSALKVVFTTLYVDIKEPAALASFDPQKKDPICLPIYVRLR